MLNVDDQIDNLHDLAETRDPETGNHILRTQEYVRELALPMTGHPSTRGRSMRSGSR